MKGSVRSTILIAACVAGVPLLGAARSADLAAAPATLADTATLTFSGTVKQAMILGQVTDAATGQPIANATVRLNRGGLSTVTTDDGRYVLAGAPVGNAQITVRVPGYVTQVKRVQLYSNRFSKVDFTLAAEEAVPAAEAPAAGASGAAF